MDADTIQTLIAGAVGGGGLTAVGNYFRNRASDSAKEAAAERQQPIDHYNSLVSKMETRIDKLEADHRDCMQSHAEGQRQVGELHGRLEELRLRVESSASTSGNSGNVLITAEKLDVKSPATISLSQVPEAK